MVYFFLNHSLGCGKLIVGVTGWLVVIRSTIHSIAKAMPVTPINIGLLATTGIAPIIVRPDKANMDIAAQKVLLLYSDLISPIWISSSTGPVLVVVVDVVSTDVGPLGSGYGGALVGTGCGYWKGGGVI
jgi:hypothetical protein